MSLSLRISPSSSSLDIYGDPDTSSAYSLCGDVLLSLRPQWSLLGRQSQGSVRIAVSSIAMTFEGQCEVVSPRHGYSATRLCSITKELVAGPGPVELETELGTEECDFNAAFSIPVPGWLPATTQLGYDSEFGVKYTLFVDVSYYTLSEEGASTSGLSFLRFCSPFFTRTRYAAVETDITLRRFMAESTPQLRTFLIPPMLPTVLGDAASALDTLASKIQLFASLPDCISTKASNFPCSVRVSAKQLDVADREKLKITMLSMNIFQVEKCRSAPSPDYRIQFPLPHDSLQPPSAPLRRPHNISMMVEVGIGHPYIPDAPNSRTISLLPESITPRTLLEEDLHFNDSSLPSGAAPGDASYVIEAAIPFSSTGRTANEADSSPQKTLDHWAGPMTLRPSAHMPLYTVKHELEVALRCTYTADSGEVLEKWVHFVVPVKFADPVPVDDADLLDDDLEQRNGLGTALESAEDAEEHTDERAPLIGTPPTQSLTRTGHVVTNMAPQRQPRAIALPAYSQLFYANGDRKIDYSVPLPLYTPFDQLKVERTDACT